MFQLHHGDCLEIMPTIPSGSVDMILCDLPYGTTAIKWDTRIPFEPLWEQYERIIKENGAICLFSAQPFTTDLINSNRKLFRYEIIWEKTMKAGFVNARKMPLRGHENILLFYKKLPTYNPVMRELEPWEDHSCVGRTRQRRKDRTNHYNTLREGGTYTDTGIRFPHDVIRFSNWNGGGFGENKPVKHPTQKPVPLLEWLVKTYTNEGEMVMDNCMGSGSTGVACVNLKRDFIGIEKEEKYFKIAEQRIKEAEAEREYSLFKE